MSARAAVSALMFSLLVAPALFRPAQAGPWLPAPGEYYCELRGSVFAADSYHNDDGDRINVEGKWEERSARATIELGWKKSVTFLMGAPIVSATAKDTAGATTSTGLEDILLGFRLGLHQGNVPLAVQLDWQAPLGYARSTSLFAQSPRGDGLQQLSLSLLGGTAIAKSGFLQVGVGGAYRYLNIAQSGKNVVDEDGTVVRYSEGKELWGIPLLASADMGLWLTKNVLVGGRYSGSMTLSHGELYPERTVHLAGPVVLYRVDDRLDLMAGSWSTALAKNYFHYDQVYVALAFKQTKLNRAQGFLGGLKTP